MWSKVFHVAICWLTLSLTFGKAENTVNSSIVKDNDSAESASRLYRNIPIGVYASAAPYAAYSYHIPAIITAPRAAASRIIPVKEQLVLHNANGYLRDSYGNKFVGTPQTAAYKNTFPQQFVPLQELPAHFAQPLLATASHSKQAAPHYFVSQQYRAPTFQVAALSPGRSYGAFTHPIVYTGNVNRFTPVSVSQNLANGLPTAQYQPSFNKAVYTNTQAVEQFQNLKNEPKFQRLEQRPEVVQNNYDNSGTTKEFNNAPIIQASPAQTSVTAIVNGKKTVFNLETKPPLPLLDLSLLEPLTFSNPSVPQVQHFSSKTSEATYNKVPENNVNDAKQHKKEVIEQKTKSYDSGIVKGKPLSSAPKKKQRQGTRAQQDKPHHKQVSVKPTITVKGIPNQSPEFSYEINSPNYKETYKEQSISYNKATDTDPIQYSYGKKTESKPINYSYHKTEHKEPVHYNVVRTSKEPVHIKQVTYQGNDQRPRHLIYTLKPEEQHDNQSETEDSGPSDDSGTSDDSGSSEDSGSAEISDEEEPPQRPSYYQKYDNHHEEPPRHAHSQSNPRPEHREKYHQRPEQHVVHNVVQNTPRHYSQPQKVSVTHSEPQFRPIHGLEENIHLSLPQTYSSPSPVQQVKHVDSLVNQNPSDGPIQHRYVQHQSVQASTPQPQHYHYGTPVIHEKAKRIIIQEQSPDEVHSHRERITAKMIDQEDNNEEDFEKAYKNAAYGFPAYDKTHEDVEKDIYDPNTYGFTSDISIDVEKSPFQEYQAPGDKFPKSARLSYKDARDNTKEDYYLDYSISRPESLADRYNNKAEYYKLYKKQRPEKYFADEQNEKKQKRKEKYILSPSYDFQAGQEKISSGYNLKYKEDPEKYEYDYSKEAPRDNSAYASRPYQRIKSKTHFVEPQFQYGFEPLGLPRLLDSELAAMASNDSPESEKPGLRKKVYKENWYIKKTSTSGGKPS